MPEPTGDPIKDVHNLIEFYKLDNAVYESKLIKGNFFSCILKVLVLYHHQDFSFKNIGFIVLCLSRLKIQIFR